MESGSKQRLRHVFEKLPAAHHISSKTVSPTCVSARAMLPLLPTTSDMVSCELTCKLLYTWICISTKFGGFWTLCLHVVVVVVGNNYMLFHCMLFCVRQDFFRLFRFFSQSIWFITFAAYNYNPYNIQPKNTTSQIVFLSAVFSFFYLVISN